MTVSRDRRGELRDSLALVRARIGAACAAAGRDPADVTLVAVTKFHPATDAALLAELAVPDLAESRDQEATAKVAAVAELTEADVHWHFVGRLQRNKARSVAGWADLVHSVDRQALLGPLAAGVRAAGRPPLSILAQVNLDAAGAGGERGGMQPQDVQEFAAAVAGYPDLRLAGVMAIAPLDADPEPAFAVLEDVSLRLRQDRPTAVIISAGMSGDLEEAVAHGATHVRVGTALLGRRMPAIG
jgi:pyridoxal phosphate enzyme (YggS family)